MVGAALTAFGVSAWSCVSVVVPTVGEAVTPFGVQAVSAV